MVWPPLAGTENLDLGATFFRAAGFSPLSSPFLVTFSLPSYASLALRFARDDGDSATPSMGGALHERLTRTAGRARTIQDAMPP